MTPQGELALVLHHHLPYVRHPEHPVFFEERWLFEALLECYLPLIESWRRLEADRVPFTLTISLSPPLVNMLGDALLNERFAAHLATLEALAVRELERTAGDPALHAVAHFYRERLERLGALYRDTLRGDLLAEYRRLQEAGRLEIVTVTATHGFLPLMNNDRAAMRAQVEVAVADYERVFGRRPAGIWPAELGYAPGVEELYADAGLRFFFAEGHGLLEASSPPLYGIFAPIAAGGVAVFGRDAATSLEVWSAEAGYPGDPDYREYYRDIGFDLDAADLAPHAPGIGTGFKYHRVTGPTEIKDVYVPARALARAETHAAEFLDRREAQVRALRPHTDRAPLVVAAFDAELFGHWWFEGPWFLEALFRELHRRAGAVAPTTPSGWLAAHPVVQDARPGPSSWGRGGYASWWCSPENEWIYPHLHHAAERMRGLARQFPRASGVQRRALEQAARELLLAQSSDWPFMMSAGTTVAYAVQRVRDHLGAFHRLAEGIADVAALDEAFLTGREAQWRPFPALDPGVYGR
jgi:1,4-alpha-glucan branching enzyme